MAITEQHPMDSAIDGLRHSLVRAGVIKPEPAEDINNVLEDPQARASYLYFEAQVALRTLLDNDPRGWEDVMVLIRRLAHDRKAFIVEAALEDARRPLDVAARYEDAAAHIEVTVIDPAR